jgi:hypothetical protein
VDSDLMYDKVMAWDWGNTDGNIYHDTETRKNGITFRGNLARLIEQLINEDKFDKAEEVADLAMKKMPLDDFGYYTLLEPFISSYYEVGALEKGRKLYKDVSKKYQENLNYFSGLTRESQEKYISEIVTDIQRYRGLVDLLVIYNDKDFALEETKKFNDYLKLFSHFTGEEEPEETYPLDDIDIVRDTIDSIIKAEE